eukprot:jgi/Botrbrau1/16921/Bobra.85_3s0003.1
MKTRSRQVIMKTRSKRTATESGSAGSGSSISASPSQPANSTAQSGEMCIAMTKTGGVVTTNVKCPVTLEREGVEFPLWDLAYVAACGLKRCKAAIEAPMPDTEENAAALLMLIESVPKAWGAKLAAMQVAANAYQWVRERFTGGADQEVTARWLELLHTSMGETETLEDYYNRKVALFHALKRNGHSIMEREAKLAIIKGLPEEAKETGMFSSSAGKDLEGLWEIISTTAKGLGFNDQVPRVTSVARAAITPAYSTTPGTASPQETQAGGQGGQASSTKVEGRDRRDNRRCRYCNKLGHFERNCLKKEADEKMQQNLHDTVETAKGCGNNGYNLFGLHLSTRPVRPGPSSAKALFYPVLSVPVSIANAPCQVRDHSLGA